MSTAPPLDLGPAIIQTRQLSSTSITPAAAAVAHPSFSRTASSALFDLMSSLPHEDHHPSGEDGALTPMSPGSLTPPSSSETETNLDLASGLPSRSNTLHSGDTVSEKPEGEQQLQGKGREGEEEDAGSLAPLPDKDRVDDHAVFRSPALDTSNLTSRLAQLSVSNLAQDDMHDEGGGENDQDDEGEETEEELVTDQEKVEAIVESFGPFEVGGKVMDEVLLAEVKGGLFRGIVILGNLHLTSRRLVFFAVIPPADLADEKGTNSIIKSGPVLVHRPGVFKSSRRVWMELGVEMVSTYPDSSPEGRTRPLKTIILSSIKKISPHDPEDPLTCVFTIATSKGDRHTRLEFDTNESALDWRRELEGALFHYKRLRRQGGLPATKNVGGETPEQTSTYGKMDDWEKVKISLPLDRIISDETADYMGFATLIALEVNNAPVPTSTDASHYTDPHPIQLQFALLNDQQRFLDAFIRAIAVARERRSPTDVSSLPLIEMDAIFREEYELEKRVGGDTEQEIKEGDPEMVHLASGEAGDELEAKLKTIFGLGEGEEMWTIPCGLQRTIIPLKGTLVISSRYVGFYRKAIGHDVKFRFLISDCVQAVTSSTYHFTMSGLALQSSGHTDTLFEFGTKAARDETMAKINDKIDAYHRSHNPDSKLSSSDESRQEDASSISSPSRTTTSSFASSGSTLTPTTTNTATTHHARNRSHGDTILASGLNISYQSQVFPDEAFHKLPAVVNLYPDAETGKGTQRRLLSARHFVMLTIGSRGDIQPYIALALGLMNDGHRCTIVTHDEFKGWIESYDGLQFRQAGGDPAALMKLSVEHRMFSPGFFQESLGHFRDWLDDLFRDSWHACQDADVLIESPSAMAGIHIAEALNIPYFRAFTMPWTRTHAYPQAFMVPPAGLEVSGTFNYSTYVLFDNIMWKATSGQVNRWRRKMLKLKPTDMSHLAQMNVPFIYNFSSAVVPYPIDWKDNIFISGYWNLENSDEDWSPPDDLNEFIKKAKADEKPLVYIGFGSIVVPNPNETTRNIIRAVEKADVRAIIAKGWSSRGEPEKDSEGNEVVVEFPESCYSMDKVPHGWLFNQIDTACHHGGAGTTGASLRAGIPTIIHPFFGDQEFWAIRVAKLGVGLKVEDLEKDALAKALTIATTDKVMRKTAAKVGEKIRSEDGVGRAIDWIYAYCERARDRHHPHRTSSTTGPSAGTDSPTKKSALSNSKLSTVGLLAGAGAKISHALKIKSKDNLDRRTD